MVEEIPQIMEDRRKHKNNITMYRDMQRKIQGKIREAKEKQVDEIEIIQQRFFCLILHKRVREITEKKRPVGKLVNDNE